MSSTWQLLFDGQSADADFYSAISSVEVEECMDVPGTLQLSLPLTRTESAELSYVADPRLAPMSNVAVVATVSSSGTGGLAGAAAAGLGLGGNAPTAQCIFDGYVLAHRVHVERGITQSTLMVWGQDASWLMNATEQVKEWPNQTDGTVANTIFATYGITPGDDNLTDDSPSHPESGHTLMQRASDMQFLRTLARRNGKFFRVVCTDTPGQRTGIFAKVRLDGDPAATLVLNDPTAWNVNALDLSWDVSQPSAVVARQALFTDASADGVSADTADSGLTLLSDHGLAEFTGDPMTVVLTTPVDDGGELTLRAQSLLRETGWFVQCEGEAEVARLGVVLRVGMLVEIDGIGGVYSGNYLVWRVHHRIDTDTHVMKFSLVRNAMGTALS